MKTRKVKTPAGWAVVVTIPLAGNTCTIFSNGYITPVFIVMNEKELDEECVKLQQGETVSQVKGFDI